MASEPIRVFVVDDHPMIRHGLAAMIRAEREFEWVGDAADGADALRLAPALAPDLVLVDLVMPRLSGFEVIDRLRTVAPDTRAIMLSGSATRSSRRAVEGAGGVACLEKAAGLRAVVPAIHAAAGR